MIDKPCILAVDDNAISLRAIDQALKNKYEVITVNSGNRAIRYLQNEKPDLILLDVRMPYKSGIETLKEIREMKNRADIPVIMLTSQQDQDTFVESVKLEVNDYMLKPFNSIELQERIRQVLEKQEDSFF